MENKSARAKVQAFGGFLTAMVIPNIGAFIAWGFITALFIPTGWLPNEHFAKIVGPMITYLLPVMIGSTGGHLVGGKRGALMNPLMILVKIIKLRWIHILSYDQMVSRKINNQTTRCANSIFYTTLFTNSAPNYT